MELCELLEKYGPLGLRDVMQRLHDCESSASPACSIAWSAKPPTEKGLYLWRQSPGIMLAIVYTMKRPDGIMIGKSYGHGERHFYEACSVDAWGGEWLGPLPQQ